MKKYAFPFFLVLLFLAVVGATVYAVPLVFRVLESSSYKFVFLFLILIAASNILAKIATKYINL